MTHLWNYWLLNKYLEVDGNFIVKSCFRIQVEIKFKLHSLLNFNKEKLRTKLLDYCSNYLTNKRSNISNGNFSNTWKSSEQSATQIIEFERICHIPKLAIIKIILILDTAAWIILLLPQFCSIFILHSFRTTWAIFQKFWIVYFVFPGLGIFK